MNCQYGTALRVLQTKELNIGSYGGMKERPHFMILCRVKSSPIMLVETMILGEAQDLPKGLERDNRIIQTIMTQLLFALDGLHLTGTVHRDIKPQNIIFSEGSRTFKIIDLGAAADLRAGINYIPKEFLLDLRYAAPEQYIMSTQTPSAPSAPVATTLSPVLWQAQIPTTISPNLIVMSLESSLSELICLLMLLINR
ncbi:hypothetical protein NC653_025375 [Populus alba x Populus x berolinensis]|uniref:Protein kinase domain-containing protein n=1 Tax=Populus alba x Populus x berolinensis TaxID=444605 RepID=A0AAD6MBE2_9ROSI|nr:hypothetical protein NC653_025375 [Populus alba x Populus x berolinensis]